MIPKGWRPGGARREREEDLSRIFDRLDLLESTPASPVTADTLRAAVDAILQSLEKRLSPVESRLDGVETEASDGERRVKELTFAVAEGIERVARHERRIHATVKRARKELADHGFESAGLEAEATELRLVDGEGGADSRVSKVSEEVEVPDEAPSSIRGVSADELRRVRGW